MWKFEVYKDDGDGWHWRLILHATLIVVDSERFERRSEAEAAAEKARSEIGAATIHRV
jgi:uncharacterized protein YegP (UPF0339 family)